MKLGVNLLCCYPKVLPVCITLTRTASGDVCHLLTTFANSLDLDQGRQNVGPDLDPNHLIVFLK